MKPDINSGKLKLLLTQSVLQNATSIHMEFHNNSFQIYFRISGKLESTHKFSQIDGKNLIELIRGSSLITPTISQESIEEGHLSAIIDNITHIFVFYIIPHQPLSRIVIRPINSAKQPEIQKKIFIWQMGKVGSASIFDSLKPYTKTMEWDVSSFITHDHWVKHNNILHIHSHEILYNFLHNNEEKFNIISLIRDPIARNISSVFQSMTTNEPWNKLFIANTEEFQSYSYLKQKSLIETQLSRLNAEESIVTWYDNLFKTHFYYPQVDKYLIDIYAKPFNQEKGYQTYESKTPRVKMIILRLEDLATLSEELGKFLGINNFEIMQTNVAKDKWYKEIYAQFLRGYNPSKTELDKIYQSKFMTYFYSPAQINSFCEKWSKK